MTTRTMLTGAVVRRVPLFLFVATAILATFFAGMYVQHARVFPYPLARSAYRTLVVNLVFRGLADADGGIFRGAPMQPGPPRIRSAECAPLAGNARNRLRRNFGFHTLWCPSAHVAHEDAAAARVEFLAGEELEDPVLVKGEVGTFLDHCPGPWGCLAVEYSRSGSVRRAWPFRPGEIAETNVAPESDYPYEHPLGWSFSRGIAMSVLSPYPDGDLAVVFHLDKSHPYGGGVARVAPDGRPRWYRKDYSHHWPHVVAEDLVLVPGMRQNRTSLSYVVGKGHRGAAMRLRCRGGMIWEDQVNVVDGRGRLLEEIPVLDAIVQSPHAGSLVGADGCNPTHLNFVHVLGADAGGAAGIAPGDLVVSLRNLNAFGILDRDDRRLKRFVRGSFQRQHGVRHLEKARFLLFDNLGAAGAGGPSRLLMVDLATGEETTLFPNDATPGHLRDFFARVGGEFDVSADRRRVLLVDRMRGQAFEIRLADGEVLNVFRQLHDVSSIAGFPEAKNAWLFRFHGIHYASRWQ